MRIDLSQEDLDRIAFALDSHIYWELSDQHYRNDGAVAGPGSDEPERVAEIAACRELAERIGTER